MFTICGKYTSADVMIDVVEESCVAQITEMCSNVSFTNKIAIMPDTHAGKGSVIGFTMKMGDKVIPSVVGVDLGCGMLAVNVGKVDVNYKICDDMIRMFVPFGFNVHKSPIYTDKFIEKYFDRYDVKDILKRIGMDYGYFCNSIGTIGGGNHFVEVSRSTNTGDKWITIHTGSRNLGKKVCDYWSKLAKKRLDDTRKGELADGMEKLLKQNDKSNMSVQIKSLKEDLGIGGKLTNLEWLEGVDKEGYLKDMQFAQLYSSLNRQTIIDRIVQVLNISYGERIESIHNFIDFSDNIIRKGAIRSYKGEKCLIPFNPKDGILVCEGKSNKDWNFSAPHGAGRVMSRSQAKRELDNDMVELAMEGVYASVRPKDESPLAYKDAKIIEAAVAPTVDIIDRLVPIMNLKSGDGEVD